MIRPGDRPGQKQAPSRIEAVRADGRIKTLIGPRAAGVEMGSMCLPSCSLSIPVSCPRGPVTRCSLLGWPGAWKMMPILWCVRVRWLRLFTLPAPRAWVQGRLLEHGDGIRSAQGPSPPVQWPIQLCWREYQKDSVPTPARPGMHPHAAIEANSLGMRPRCYAG